MSAPTVYKKSRRNIFCYKNLEEIYFLIKNLKNILYYKNLEEIYFVMQF